MCPNVSIGHVSRPHSFTFHQLYHQRWRSEAFRFAVGLRELTEGWRVRDVVVKQVLDESLAASARSSQFVVKIRNELFHVLHHSRAYPKQTQEENQTSTDSRDKVKSHFFWKAWKGEMLKIRLIVFKIPTFILLCNVVGVTKTCNNRLALKGRTTLWQYLSPVREIDSHKMRKVTQIVC